VYPVALYSRARPPLDMTPGLRDMLESPERITSVPRQAIPAILGELEALRVGLLARLLTQPTTATSPSDPGEKSATPDRLLRPAEAAALLGVTTRWLHRHHRTLPFARKLSHRALRFDEAGLHRWLAHRHG
jgi:predicted DNA-binding transcriptional regulator AlpA